MPFLTVRTHDDGMFRFEFRSSSIRIGRSTENDLVLTDPTASRQHAIVKFRSDGPFLIDLGSRAGTFVNGRRVTEPIRVERGDAIRLGRTQLAFDTWLTPPVELDDSLHSSESSATRISLDETSVVGRTPRPIERVDEPGLLAFLAEVDAEVAVHRPSMELYRRVIAIARKAVPFERAALMTLEDGKLVAQAQYSTRGAPTDSITFSRSISEEVIREKQAILVKDARTEYGTGADSIRSVMCVPLWTGRRVEGILYMDSTTRPQLFTEQSLQMLTHLAHVVAIKVENKRLFDAGVKSKLLLEELRHAAEIQSQFLPSSAPEIEGYRLRGFNRPSFAVGGDFFNYFPFEDGRYGIALGDVAGNGLPAALMMCSFQPLLRGVLEGSRAADESMNRLNRLLCEQIPVNRFITAFLAILDPRDNLLTFANAGQTSPLLIDPVGTVSRLEPTGLPLGVICDSTYGTSGVTLVPGCTLLIYSDGLTEISDASGEEFGEERLEIAAVDAAKLPPEEMLRCVLRAAEDHAGDDATEDDITAVILQRHE